MWKDKNRKSWRRDSMLYLTRWLPGFARVPHYAPSPCHIHPRHNCHHIKSCHPPDKQYTQFIIYTCSLFFICNNKVPMARAHCGIGCEYTVYSGYLPWSFISLLPCSILSSRNPSPARFLPPAAHASPRSFLACSHHQPSLPQPSLPPLTLRACVASLLPLSLPPSLPPSPCSLPPSFPPSLPPSLPLFPLPPSPCSLPLPPLPPPPSVPPTFYSPSPLPCLILSLPPSLPPLVPSVPPTFYSPALLPCPSLPACLVSCNSIYTVCVYSVGELHWLLFREGQPCVALRQWRGRAINRWLAVTLATHPHHESVFYE